MRYHYPSPTSIYSTLCGQVRASEDWADNQDVASEPCDICVQFRMVMPPYRKDTQHDYE